jgi:hypothetical protein
MKKTPFLAALMGSNAHASRSYVIYSFISSSFITVITGALHHYWSQP